MADPIIRHQEGLDPSATPLWDTVWRLDFDPENPGSGAAGAAGDWATVEDEPPEPESGIPPEPNNRGGLRARDQLATAIILCLFTDRRRPDDVEAPDGSAERRGWHGDTFDMERGEAALGSLLWTLERGVLNYETQRRAEYYAAEALEPLIAQGAVERFDIVSEIDKDRGLLGLRIAAHGPSGEALFAGDFELRG
jgi:phage gp46-like protein